VELRLRRVRKSDSTWVPLHGVSLRALRVSMD